MPSNDFFFNLIPILNKGYSLLRESSTILPKKTCYREHYAPLLTASPPSTVSIHISDDEEEEVLIEGLLTSQWESKATPRTLEKLRDYHIPTSIELRIPSPNENMATPPKGCVALSLNVASAQLNLVIYKAIMGHCMLWRCSGMHSDLSFDEFRRLYQLKSVSRGSSCYYLAGWLVLTQSSRGGKKARAGPSLFGPSSGSRV
ncbi:hypothetical protein WN943_010756 [Citrus x changshan-huyou]